MNVFFEGKQNNYRLKFARRYFHESLLWETSTDDWLKFVESFVTEFEVCVISAEMIFYG